ncbi:dehydrogenase/reductase SDR family member 4-like [Varroa jacobsoni]|uniref:Dehydrogenase/reductase SDR family member 4 n=1 Tax=Varroa destructor TaxID=109461 RepID=A0A7M7KDC1_VARDE|nr:dehydrogenase/reductase SDR family member 4-like [Varroa destructor]XP_022665126.1 dehydrogenase/reductase SDR family member 4-like [Varroa destructor]XP_022710476.1 dehydrogenase/reductase SDR family member 4-like [Varroa jacobsoni]XP_022710479.1 dehydrogenase/reductase SDR family member 4-like [Varroa jacobsoni]
MARSASSAAPRLQGKVAIVTASTDGIGFAIARRLGQEGANIVISSRKQAHVDNAVDQLSKEGLSVTGVPCHVGDTAQRANLFKVAKEKFGGLDILVSNAAVNPSATQVFDTPESAWDKIFDINVKCAFLLTQEALPLLERSSSPSIIYISSIAAYQTMPMLGAYSVSKTALLGLTRAAAVHLAPKIRVNCVAPGIIKTRFSQLLWEDETVCKEMMEITPLKRLGVPEDISGAVAFLVSDDASYITGEILPVAGGFFCKI